jgi:hypothetical protein
VAVDEIVECSQIWGVEGAEELRRDHNRIYRISHSLS